VFGDIEWAGPHFQCLWHPYYVDALAVRMAFTTDGNYNFTQFYARQDANYNVTAMLDSTGTVQERYSYTPYGEVTLLNSDFSIKAPQVSQIGNNVLFTGRERDSDTGLQLNRFRFYAPHLGRWLTRDPALYWGGMNLYGYVAGKPSSFVDPFGLGTIHEVPPQQPPQPCPLDPYGTPLGDPSDPFTKDPFGDLYPVNSGDSGGDGGDSTPKGGPDLSPLMRPKSSPGPWDRIKDLVGPIQPAWPPKFRFDSNPGQKQQDIGNPLLEKNVNPFPPSGNQPPWVDWTNKHIFDDNNSDHAAK
jgi:RHS repeat-associated protein